LGKVLRKYFAKGGSFGEIELTSPARTLGSNTLLSHPPCGSRWFPVARKIWAVYMPMMN
jgi:hypothetical protein